jgi:hypothetical protein
VYVKYYTEQPLWGFPQVILILSQSRAEQRYTSMINFMNIRDGQMGNEKIPNAMLISNPWKKFQGSPVKSKTENFCTHSTIL